MRPSALLLALALPSLAATFAAPHEDDPKVLDRRPPYRGPGFRPVQEIAGRLAAGASGVGGRTQGAVGDELGQGSIQFDHQGVHLLSWLPPGELSDTTYGANDCWGYVSPSGREIGIIGLFDGAAFVDLTIPSDPVQIGHVPGVPSLWRDIKVFQNYAYIVTEGDGGIQVVDLSGVDGGVVTLVNTVTSGGTLATHNVALDEVSGYLYRCGGNGQGIRVYDLNADPAAPQYVGSWSSRYVHDAQVVTYTSGPYAGRQIAFLCGGLNNGFSQPGLTVLDVTDKGNMFVRSQVTYPQPAYSHQAWLGPDRHYLYLDDELDEGGGKQTRTIVLDVSDLDDVQVASTFTASTTAIGHNLYARGSTIFEANYRSGLRVFDATDPLAPTEVGWFDTWPGDDHAAFNGLWSNYPFFPSGIVIGSDVEKGLFVWWVGQSLLDFDFPGGPPERVAPEGGTIEVTIGEAQPGDLAVGSERLWFDAGEGLVELALTSLGGGQYRADLPALACGGELHWFVGARSTNGILWTSPAEAPFSSHVSLLAHDSVTAFADDMEVDLGWTVGSPGDDALTGLWVRGNPKPTQGQPGDDHTPNGTQCWYTGVGQDEVNGTTSLVSPALDLSAYDDPRVEAWCWFTNGDELFKTADDYLEVALSGDDGVTWTKVTSLKPFGPDKGSWRRVSFAIGEHLAPSATVRLRFRARDGNISNVIEAAVDDVRIVQPLCGCGWQSTCSTSPNSAGPGATIGASGSASIAANDLVLEVASAPPGQFGLFFYGPDATQVPVGDGFLCVGGKTARLPVTVADGAGSVTWPLDLGAPPNSDATIRIGSRWYFQLWYRDPAFGGAGYNFSDALAVDFCP